MVNINPPPQKVPENAISDFRFRDFIKRITASVYTMFYAIGGQDGIPKNFKVEGTPVDGVNAAGYLKININGEDKFIAYYE